MEIYHKVEGDSLTLRWFPLDIDIWQDGVTSGYQITLNEQGGATILDTVVSNSLEIHKEDSETLSSLYSLGSYEQLMIEYMKENPDTVITNEFSDTIRYEAFNLLASRNRKLLTKSGFLLSTGINPEQKYELTIEVNNNQSTKSISQIDPSSYKQPKVPTLSSKWKSKIVDLSWNTKNTKKDFFFYNMYSSNDGESWNKIDSLYANFYDESDDESLLSINPSKSLMDNDTTYWFKIHGIDFFGDESIDYSLVKGSGSKGIQVSPYFKSVKQLRSNEAHMKWDIPAETKPEVSEFRIYVAENYDGPYSPDTIGLSSNTFEIKREIPFRSAYFRVVAVDKNEEEFSSFPQLVVGVDTLAPDIPQNLSYTIDTTGQVQIKWDPNDEEDFIGYKLFYCYDTTVDMTLAHNSYLISPEFIDTLELKTTTRDVYYKAISVDKRNNRSAFSKMLVVRKPDILPPVEPVFLSAKGGPGSSEILWYASISEDVKEQRLFRRKLGEESSWTLLEIWDIDIDTSYIDRELIAFQKYAYTLTVIDSAGNESDASRPVISMPLPDYRNFDATRWQARFIEGNVQITHDFDPKVFEQIFIYRKIENGNLYIIGELEAKESLFIDEKIDKNKVYSYAIKVMFKEGIETPLSEFKEIKI